MSKLRIMAFSAAAFAAASLFAETETVDGVVWTFTLSDGKAEIYKGESSAAIPVDTAGAVVVPSRLGGCPVTSIGAWAFYNCGSITGVTVPDGVTSIGKGAFQSCAVLSNVVVPDSVVSIGAFAFSGCRRLTSVAVPGGIDVIEPGVFLNSGLTEFAIPAGVTSIGVSAFELCTALESVSIPEGVTSIGAQAFYGCTALESVVVPESVKTIGDYAFYDCRGLKSVSLPDGVEDFGRGVFMLTLYTVTLHSNAGSDGETADFEFEYDVKERLPSMSSLGWTRRGYEFKGGWATSSVDAVRGTVCVEDKAIVFSPVDPCGALDLYAAWTLLPGHYAITFIRNDGAGTWRTVGFPYGTKTRMPSLAGELGWARRGYEFKGWELTTADANDNTREEPWKADWAYVSKPVAAGKTFLAYARWELKAGYYQIRFNKNDGSGKWRSLGFERGTKTKISTVGALGWERPGCTFKGWASNKANADAGKVWKSDGEWVTDAISEGRTLSVYAIWE